jgi:predicted enzyme related to lactoylglutathione lyase
MLDLNSILVFSEDPKKLADFYQKVFDKKPNWAEGSCFGFMVGKGFLTICPHDKVKGKNMNPERIMFNFETKNVKGEFERVMKLGATVIAEPYNPAEDPKAWIATLSDPDSNYFQLVTPWKM